MAANEDFCRFLVGLAGEISNDLKRSMQYVGQGFSKHLANLLTVISGQGMLEVGGIFKTILPSLGTGLCLLMTMYC